MVPKGHKMVVVVVVVVVVVTLLNVISNHYTHLTASFQHNLGKPVLRYRQITTPAHLHSYFYRLDALPATEPTLIKH